MTIQELKKKELIIYECISGSKAYGLDLPTSDTDIKGVYILPKNTIYGLQYIPQVADKTNDTIYYELGRFLELLAKSNPNILELLAVPADKVLIKHPIIDEIKPSLFLSKKCKDTFGGYAFSQVKKARGLNKKIVNPVDKVKKTIFEFCYVLEKHGSVPLNKWLVSKGIPQERCGLVKIPHARDLYGLYYDAEGILGYKGILRKEKATTVLLSSIPKAEKLVGYLSFNQDGYIKYCKDYTDYWNWVALRNEARYENNIEHGKNYDSKNMMHTFRLLDMAKEILARGEIIVKRPNRAELLAIRKGEWLYDDLIQMAEQKMQEVEEAYQFSTLPEAPNEAQIEVLLVNLRKKFYGDSLT